jgi:hypothetical protein
MTCEGALARLDDFVDGELSETAFQEVELHLAGCATCAKQAAALRALVAQAADLPRTMAPAHDLWPEIAKQLQPRRPATVERLGRRWTWGAIAAAATIVVATLLWHTDERVPLPAPTPDAKAQQVSLAIDHDYEQAAAELLKAIEARRGRLTPDARARVDESLRVIAQALAAIRVELIKAPGDPALNHLLLSVHQKRIEVLRTLAQLTT